MVDETIHDDQTKNIDFSKNNCGYKIGKREDVREQFAKAPSVGEVTEDDKKELFDALSKDAIVYYAKAPAIFFNGQSVEMKTRMCREDSTLQEAVEQIKESCKGVENIFLYSFDKFKTLKITDDPKDPILKVYDPHTFEPKDAHAVPVTHYRIRLALV